jgi:hypothetical protein
MQRLRLSVLRLFNPLTGNKPFSFSFFFSVFGTFAGISSQKEVPNEIEALRCVSCVFPVCFRGVG